MNLGDFSIIGGVSGGSTSAWEGDYGFIYEFIKILERLFQAIMGIVNGLSGAGTTTPEGSEGDENGAGNTEG